MARTQLGNILYLALRDYVHEWRMSTCFILALAAVLGPMMVLFGLKFGIVTHMVEDLVQNPHNREIRNVGSGRFTPAWFDTMAARPDVGFLVPETRSLASTIKVHSEQAGRIIDVELIPSGPGDPLLPSGTAAPTGFHQAVLSAAAARQLEVGPGDTVRASVSRRFRGQRERETLEVEVTAVAPATAFGRDGAFVAVPFVTAMEDFRDGRRVAALGWDGDPAVGEERRYPSYRLYAAAIGDVAGLRDALEAAGMEVRTNAAEIESVQAIDRNLSLLFWVVAVVGLVGFSLSLGASLWANVDRKRRELSILRLVGFRTGSIIGFPLLQSLFTGVLGWALGSLIYVVVQETINRMLAAQMATRDTICLLLPEHYAWALGITLVAAVMAALLGGFRAAGIEPSDGIREI
ncbi:MAG: ABC transporter permease [Gammaproteobacteria bacterium]|nr:ABC transporter permease [Gammaproteobacteria bacterium]